MIIVVNFGSQFTHLISRRLHELGVAADICLPEQLTNQDIERAQAFILSGGPEGVSDENIAFDEQIFTCGKPILGLCYGHQLIAHRFGGKVASSHKREYGAARLTVLDADDLFAGLDDQQTVWMSHGDSVSDVPEAFRVLATSDGHPAAIAHNEQPIFGMQFHPEVHHTAHGTQMLKNFVSHCGIATAPVQARDPEQVINDIKTTVGDACVIMGVSGGVDSLVASYALHKAIGTRLFCVYIDTGLMRHNEQAYVQQMYDDLGFVHFQAVDASELFLSRLAGVADPERKRTIIGHTFIEVFEETVARMKDAHGEITFLGQGTIYPDTIESAESSKTAHKIKSHHNVTLPERMQLKLVEPLRMLYKDEVRQLGRAMHIPDDYLDRHPFPGPGLAVRILGAIDARKVEIVRKADHIFISALKEWGHYSDAWQAFVALIPVKTVGVMGDARTYEYMLSLRAVSSVDAMTADWVPLPANFLHYVSNTIINEVDGVNRVVYDITQKPPGTIEYE